MPLQDNLLDNSLFIFRVFRCACVIALTRRMNRVTVASISCLGHAWNIASSLVTDEIEENTRFVVSHEIPPQQWKS